MSTKDRLAKLASSVSATDLAREARISTKTVTRLRQKKANPTLEMIEAVEAAVAAIQARQPAPNQQAA